MLKMLSVIDCFSDRPNQPSAIIVAPQLKFLNWMDPYGPSSLHLCQIKCLQTLSIIFLAYGPEGFTKNHASLRLLRRFKVIECLHITLIYPRGMGNFKNLMGDITGLPQAMVLNLSVSNEGHAFGASLFHLLKMCTGLRRLSLVLYTCRNLEAQSACPSGCVCDEPINWKTEELTLNCLQEVVIVDLKGTNHEVAFIRRLLSWAMMLKNMRITFDLSISESKARELRQMLSSFTRPDSHGEFYMYRNAGKKLQYLLAP
uniref:FBD domain-containing protein n=1 Tax=Arundo donax TaxID=35708 RepID=A0A0A9CYA2_ARUDO